MSKSLKIIEDFYDYSIPERLNNRKKIPVDTVNTVLYKIQQSICEAPDYSVIPELVSNRLHLPIVHTKIALKRLSAIGLLYGPVPVPKYYESGDVIEYWIHGRRRPNVTVWNGERWVIINSHDYYYQYLRNVKARNQYRKKLFANAPVSEWSAIEYTVSKTSEIYKSMEHQRRPRECPDCGATVILSRKGKITGHSKAECSLTILNFVTNS
jgi:hypothetical protein